MGESMNQAGERTVFKALSQIQAELAEKGIAKNDQNTYDNYKFRGIDAVLNAVSPIFAKHGVVLLPSQESCEIRTVHTAKGMPMNHCKVVMAFTFYDQYGDSVTSKFPGEAMDRGDKSVNKACTAAYKYFLFEALCIPVEGTPDADGESHEVGEPIVSEDDVSALTGVLAAGDPVKYAEFKAGYSIEQWTELFNAAPKGQKTAWKQACREMDNAFVEVIDGYQAALMEAVEASDSSAVTEVVEELTEFEKKAVWARLTDIQKHQVKNIKDAA